MQIYYENILSYYLVFLTVFFYISILLIYKFFIMKKINFCVGLLLVGVSSFANDISNVKNAKQVKDSENRIFEYACCTRSSTISQSDGRGNVTTITRTEEACVNNGQSAAATMPTACAAAQSAANAAALKSLSFALTEG